MNMSKSIFLISLIISLPAFAQNTPPADTASNSAQPTKDASGVSVSSTKISSSTATSDATATTTGDASSVTSVETKTATTVTTVTTTKVKPVETIVVKKIMPDYKLPPEPIRLSPKGPNSVTAAIGIQSGISDNATGGFVPAVGYSYQLSRVLWFDSTASVNFGGDCSKDENLGGYACGGLNGFGINMLGGLMWRFLDQPNWKIPLNPYVRILTGISFIISNGPNDGFAIIAKAAGGARYSLTDDFAFGAELGFMFGPSFRNELSMGAFAAVDFLLTVEYSF